MVENKGKLRHAEDYTGWGLALLAKVGTTSPSVCSCPRKLFWRGQHWCMRKIKSLINKKSVSLFNLQTSYYIYLIIIYLSLSCVFKVMVLWKYVILCLWKLYWYELLNLRPWNMLELFRSFSSLFKIRHLNTDGLVFKLHYRATVSVLSVFCVLMAARQYVGDPISCIHTADISKDVLNTFCWIHSTFSIPSAFLKEVGVEVPYLGVDNSRSGYQQRKEHRYYQWVVFCLLLQVS